MTIICKSLKVLWVKRLLNDDPKQWKVIPIHFLKNVGGRFLFKCNYDIKTLNVKIPPMYKRIIQVWSELTHKTLLRRQTKYVTNSYGTIDLYIDKSQIRLVGDWHEQGLNRTENILTPDGAFVLYNDLTQNI